MINNNINNDPTRCPVCSDPFSSHHSHRPKMLPCSHTSCEACLHQWANRSNPCRVRCPQCDRDFAGLHNVDDDVPVNQGLLDVLAMLSSSSELGKRKEDDDQGDGSSGKKSKWLSFFGRSQRVEHQQHQQHQQQQEEGISSSASSSSCTDHNAMSLTVYCLDCKKPGCDRCALFAHRSHNYIEIHQGVHKIKADLEAHVKQVNEMVDEWKTRNMDLVAAMTTLKSKEEELLKIADQICDELHEILEQERLSMKKRVVEEMKQHCDEVSSKMEETTKKIGEGEKMITAGERLVMGRRGEDMDMDMDKDSNDNENNNDDASRLIEEGKAMSDSIKQYVDECRGESYNNDSINDERLEEVKIYSDQMKEAKMLLEEGLKSVMGGCWKEFAVDGGSDDDDEEEEEDEDEDDDEEEDAADDNPKLKSRLEAKREQVRRLLNCPVTIGKFVKCKVSPYGVAWSSDGERLYCGMWNEIHEIDGTNGKTIRTFGSHESISNLWDISVSRSGHMYVCDDTGHTVHVINELNGELIRSLGSSKGSGDGQFSEVCAVCVVDDWDEVFVVEQGNNRIQAFSMSDGRFIRTFGSHGTGAGSFLSPFAIAIDASCGLVFVSDYDNNRIQVFDRDGGFVPVICRCPHTYDIALDTVKKHVIVCANSRIRVFDYEGNKIGDAKNKYENKASYLSLSCNRQLAISSDDPPGIFVADLSIDE